jgi:hypothetical protein
MNSEKSKEKISAKAKIPAVIDAVASGVLSRNDRSIDLAQAVMSPAA